MPVKLTPLKDLRVFKHQIPAHGLTPNTSLQHKPLLIYKSAFPTNVTAGEIESHLTAVGVVEPQWRYTMYSRSHFHVSDMYLWQMGDVPRGSEAISLTLADNVPRSFGHISRQS